MRIGWVWWITPCLAVAPPDNEGQHGIKGFVIPTKFLVAATKNVFVVPNFVAVTKPLFFV